MEMTHTQSSFITLSVLCTYAVAKLFAKIPFWLSIVSETYYASHEAMMRV